MTALDWITTPDYSGDYYCRDLCVVCGDPFYTYGMQNVAMSASLSHTCRFCKGEISAAEQSRHTAFVENRKRGERTREDRNG